MARRKVAECGTDSGYYRHIRGNKTTPPTPPCEPCLVAHADAVARTKEARTGIKRKYVVGSRVSLRRCPDCGTRVSAYGRRCRHCASEQLAGVPWRDGWHLVRGVWKPGPAPAPARPRFLPNEERKSA